MAEWWQVMAGEVGADFADLPSLGSIIRILLRLIIAAVLGGILGYQRELVGKEAGLRTHMLVALGAAIFVLIPQQAGMHIADMSRVMQGLIAGIGFLGAGTILKLSDQGEIRGLTTAASIWVTAGVGMAAGLGREVSAILATALAFIILALFPRVEQWLVERSKLPKR